MGPRLPLKCSAIENCVLNVSKNVSFETHYAHDRMLYANIFEKVSLWHSVMWYAHL